MLRITYKTRYDSFGRRQAFVLRLSTAAIYFQASISSIPISLVLCHRSVCSKKTFEALRTTIVIIVKKRVAVTTTFAGHQRQYHGNLNFYSSADDAVMVMVAWFCNKATVVMYYWLSPGAGQEA